MKRYELRELIREELLKENTELTQAENAMWSGIVKYSTLLKKTDSKVWNEFWKIKKDFEEKVMKLIEKNNL